MSGTLTEQSTLVPSGAALTARPAAAETVVEVMANIHRGAAAGQAKYTEASVAAVPGAQPQAVLADVRAAAASRGETVDEGPDSYFLFSFLSSTGDRYSGIVLADSADHYAGQWFPSPYGQQYGFYVIEQELAFGYDLGAGQEGQVVVTQYFDAQTNSLLPGWKVGEGLPATTLGLRDEYDFAQVGGAWNDCGWGGYAVVA